MGLGFSRRGQGSVVMTLGFGLGIGFRVQGL